MEERMTGTISGVLNIGGLGYTWLYCMYIYIYTVYAIKYDPTIYSKTWLEIFQAEKSHTI